MTIAVCEGQTLSGVDLSIGRVNKLVPAFAATEIESIIAPKDHILGSVTLNLHTAKLVYDLF